MIYIVHYQNDSIPDHGCTCGWAMRARKHCELFELPFKMIKVFRGVENHPDVLKIYDSRKPMPQIYDDGEYIGGFYDLVERFPV